MIEGWYESKGYPLEGGDFLLSYDVFFKRNDRFTKDMTQMALSVYVQTWGVRLLEELKEREGMCVTEMEFEDDMFALRLHVTSKERIRERAKKKRGMLL